MTELVMRSLALLLVVVCGCVHADRPPTPAYVVVYCNAVCTTEIRCRDLRAGDEGRCHTECGQIIAAVTTRMSLPDYEACTQRCLARPCGEVLRCIADECNHA